MPSMLVIRRRPAAYFSEGRRQEVADFLSWTPEAVAGALVGEGWCWTQARSVRRDPATAIDKLRSLGLQTGIIDPEDAADLEEIREYRQIHTEEDGSFVLRGETGVLRLGREHAGGISLVGMRWDGREIRSFTRFAAKAGAIVWGTEGPLGIIWLRGETQRSGMSAAELALFLEQSVKMHALRLIDDSFRPDDLPTVGSRIRDIWTSAGGDPADAKVLAHGVMLRAFERGGLLQTVEAALPDVNAPLTIYPVEKRPWSLPDVVGLLAAGTSISAAVGITYVPSAPAVTVLGIAAALSAMVYGLRSVHRWMRLRMRPLSKIRSMAIGPVHLEGTFAAAMLQVSPMRGVRALYFRTWHQRRSKMQGFNRGRSFSFNTNWQTIHKQESPPVPFYVEDETGRVLIDSRTAEWHGLEKYTHRIGPDERVLEWVFADSMAGSIYGLAINDPASPVLTTIRDSLHAQFLTEAAGQFDLNRDGVFDSTERLLARRILDEKLAAERRNLTISKGVLVRGTRDEPLVISSRRGLHIHVKTILSASLWIAVAFFWIFAVFVFRDEVHALFRSLAMVVL